MDYDLIVVKTLERVYKNYYYIIRGENIMGMYTEINVCFDLLRDTPKDIVDILHYLIDRTDIPSICQNINFSSVIDGTW